MIIIQPYNPGMILEKIPDDAFQEFKNHVLEKRKVSDPSKSEMKKISQILSIKDVDDTPYVGVFNDYLIDLFKRWCDIFNVKCTKFGLQSVWTNYMKPGEFAPMHKHSPALTAFVTWIKIPYHSLEEKRVHYDGDHLDDTNRNGAFEFLYSRYDGTQQLHRMELDSNDEGKIFMFPGSLMHCVYPFFSSEQERISVAGNFYSID